MAKIFITGITGFLGSNIAEYLISMGHNIVAVYRPGSSKKLCITYEDKVKWILQDNDSWRDNVINEQSEIVIHSAWLGVGYEDRKIWYSQLENIDYIKEILFIAEKSKSKKFIGLGSQAEYGTFSGSVDETFQLSPTEAYGSVKIICSELVKQFCSFHKIEWYWLRLFSFFGKGESSHWLIPALVNNLINKSNMDFTAGEQTYAYLPVKDLGIAVNLIIKSKDLSGIYNISGGNLIKLKSLIERVKNQINPEFKLNFGVLPYRHDQPMHMQGDSTKFIFGFGEFELSDFDNSLKTTVNYLVDQFKGQSVHESM